MATRRTGSRSRSSGAGTSHKAWGRLTKSIDTADDALRELRKELGRGGKEVLKDLEKALKDSRKGVGSAQKSAAKNAEKLQRVVTTGRKTKPTRSSASSRTKKSSASGAKRSTAKRSTAKRSTAKRAPAKKSASSRSGSTRARKR
jgi:hypothetical protein